MTPVIYRGQRCYAEPRGPQAWKVYTGPGEGDWHLAHTDELEFLDRSTELPAVPANLDAALDDLKVLSAGAAVLIAGVIVGACLLIAALVRVLR